MQEMISPTAMMVQMTMLRMVLIKSEANLLELGFWVSLLSGNPNCLLQFWHWNWGRSLEPVKVKCGLEQDGQVFGVVLIAGTPLRLG